MLRIQLRSRLLDAAWLLTLLVTLSAPPAGKAQTSAPTPPGSKSCMTIDQIVPASPTPSSQADSSGAPSTPAGKPATNPALNRDICIRAHVFDLVELADGTRFLDVCPANQPDDACRFTLVSLPADRDEVGDLRKYRDQDVTVRGILRATHGRMGIVISHARQFSGGPEKFRPNPKLLKDFNAASNRTPVRDPNLAPSGRHRSFMNTRDTEPLPAKH